MENVSAVTSFILTAYTELEHLKYLNFLWFLILYKLILLTNFILILIIYIEKSLQQPMYLFLCSLAVNELYGSTCLFPGLLHYLQSYDYEISLTNCLLQIFFLHSYGSVEFTLLAVMSYDRYVAVCHPLHYHQLMTHRKVCIITVISWVYPHIYFALYFISTAQQTFCHRLIEDVYCSNFALVKLSCHDIRLYGLIGLALLVVLPGPQIVMILFSYAKILHVCLSASKKSQAKALQTCTPHLMTFINYAVACVFKVVTSRFDMSHVPPKTRLFYSLYCMIAVPLFNPLIYGICIQTIRIHIYRLFNCRKSVVTQQKAMIK